MRRSGTADLPLHYGRVPQWLGERMTRMARAIVSAIVQERGASEFLARVSDPFWFQALGCVMGMDWHSSGITTSVVGALRRAINPIHADLGLYVCGGRGAHSRDTPRELLEHSARTGLDGTGLVTASKLSAKVDNTCVQDGFSLYLHGFIVSDKGEWTVVQQGMNRETAMARRYHWHSATVRSFVDDPQSGIVGENQGAIVNLSDSRSGGARDGIIDFLRQHPDTQLREMKRLVMGRGHQVRKEYVDSKRLGAIMAVSYEAQLSDFVKVLMLPGVGPRALQSLALVSEVIYGAPSRFTDPARFSFAHGGKDGAPFPVPLKIYDQSLGVLRDAVDRAKVGRSEKLEGLRKLHALTRVVEERCEPHADIDRVIAHEREHSREWGGRTVFDDSRIPRRPPKPRHGEQLSLFGPPSR